MEAEATVVKKKVLIIEDSAFISRVLESRFIEEGFEVSVCLDGESGLMAAKSKKPDLIILDLILPKLSGEAVCKEIRKDEELKAVPVVMLTAKNSEADKIIGRVIGADKYLPKPLDADKLFKEVRELI